MKKSVLTLTLALLCSQNVFAQDQPTLDPGKSTYTYVRCWYRSGATHDEASTEWKWAKNSDGSYYTVPGYWYSSVSPMNMFFTDVGQETIKQQCKQTLGIDHNAADITYFASDMRYSFNHSFWTNDKSNQTGKINKIVSFGDSISDTGNIFNAFQWRFPNPNSWFLGHFSNGFVWTEYLAQEKHLPLYTWAVGGAAGETEYGFLSGIHDQVNSYLQYMTMAKNYNPQNTLFTIEFGLNDFINYNRTVAEVSKDFTTALTTLFKNGAENIVVLTLPDASIAPQFKYSTPEHAQEVSAKIKQFNQYVTAEAMRFRMEGHNVALFDSMALFNDMTTTPAKYGFHNIKDACLNINRSSSKDYLMSHALTNDCASYSSDSYMFWGVTHPTTHTHHILAEEVAKKVSSQFNF
ncbi:thermolabile hemolysin [Photobacterium damselae subsp. damselae]|uniref:SGNH/GDSL hydrolase family protein n=1 Tax=Photobacterium damselae TaxID=38293 RepID=UPI000A2FF073|nr:SGNH/GDSL hydrolase family protein [Photobacterium damselae]ARR49120.1 thermolabile hemolysin [Photobacterium damselae subsp. damselae]QAY36327.1 thermolabile hemolysin [Photobacterium damselae subsp. damselae]